jgi:hypothetical protein
MSIYNRRNAAVGYVTIKALRHAMNRKQERERRRKAKIAAYVGLGVISAGILAAALAIALRRRDGDNGDVLAFADDDIVGEVVNAPEPVPAT